MTRYIGCVVPGTGRACLLAPMSACAKDLPVLQGKLETALQQDQALPRLTLVGVLTPEGGKTLVIITDQDALARLSSFVASPADFVPVVSDLPVTGYVRHPADVVSPVELSEVRRFTVFSICVFTDRPKKGADATDPPCLRVLFQHDLDV